MAGLSSVISLCSKTEAENRAIGSRMCKLSMSLLGSSASFVRSGPRTKGLEVSGRDPCLFRLLCEYLVSLSTHSTLDAGGVMAFDVSHRAGSGKCGIRSQVELRDRLVEVAMNCN